MRVPSSAPSPLFLLLLALAVAGGALAALTTGAARTTGIVLLVLGGWAVALCLHEFSHALTAYRGGDESVRAKGYLTLDIRRYTDPVMSLLLPLVLLALGGIPLPGGAVWINREALRSRAVASAVALAGPLTNLALGAALTAVVATIPLPEGLAAGLSWLALVQVLAFVLNILPVPGLDGFGVIEPYLPAPARQLTNAVGLYATLALFILIISVSAVSKALFGAGFTVFAALGGDPFAAADGFREFLFWR
ncbi:MAG: site-2 protease family protein [Pseudonocardiales bacterium]|nr:site-2 protease family protein [Pseudonocardiales bacterium]